MFPYYLRMSQVVAASFWVLWINGTINHSEARFPESLVIPGWAENEHHTLDASFLKLFWYCFSSLRWALKAYCQQPHRSSTPDATSLVKKKKSRTRGYWHYKNACLILNIVFQSGQIEQFFLLKRYFPGRCVCTQLFSPKILCPWAPCRQSHGSVYTRIPTYTDSRKS